MSNHGGNIDPKTTQDSNLEHETNPKTEPMEVSEPIPSSTETSNEECVKPSKIFTTSQQIITNPRKSNSSQNSDQLKSCLGLEASIPHEQVPNRPQISNTYLTYELRKDHDFSMVHDPNYNVATVSAFSWVGAIWAKFLEHWIPRDVGIKVVKTDRFRGALDATNFLHRLDPNSLLKLQLFARNESHNVTGIIKRELYGKIPIEVVTSLKDLVRQTVIVSRAQGTHFGGYRIPRRAQSSKVYVCDLSALQFQNKFNTGRLVLISRYDTLQRGVLDEEIFRHVVSETRSCPDFRETERYVPCKSRVFGEVLFDKVAYKRFVARDVVLAGLALNLASERDNGEALNFKFLKYGSGFFAGDFTHIIETNILNGVLDGVEELFGNHGVPCIRQVELPFFQNTEKKRVLEIEERFSRKIVFSAEDALKTWGDGGLVTATTNCADPHAVFGNEMGCQSVDAAIAENLVGKGGQFCPLINEKFEEFLF